MHQEDSTKKKLLEATLELISVKGYLGATTREIASLAGVSELTLFRKFGKKEKLFEEMLETYTFLPQLRNLLEDIYEMPVQEGLSTVGTEALKTLQERRRLVQILLSEVSHYPQQVRKIYQFMIDNLARMLEGYLLYRKGHGEVKNLDMDFASYAFLRALFMTFVHECIIREEELSLKRIESDVHRLVEIFLYGITPGREA